MDTLINGSLASGNVRLIIVDDHPLIRSGLAFLISREPRFELVAEAVTGLEAIAKVQQFKPDVVLMDLKMPEMGGLEAIVEIRKTCPNAHIVILTTFDDEEDIHRALQAGAKAYLLKDSPSEEIVRCIKVVATGRKFIPNDVAARLAERMEYDQLSVRELEILRFLVSGKGNKAIARMAGIGEGTVKYHVNNILAKLSVSSRTEAVTVGVKRGLVEIS